MVFRKEAAPSSKAEFMDWYAVQTEWSEEHSYDDPAITSPELRNWFIEMIESFPAMNGPYATDIDEEDDDADKLTDYSIGRDVIYATFSWSLVEEAYEEVSRLATKHKVGFFDVSADDGDIIIPNDDGTFDYLS